MKILFLKTDAVFKPDAMQKICEDALAQLKADHGVIFVPPGFTYEIVDVPDEFKGVIVKGGALNPEPDTVLA